MATSYASRLSNVLGPMMETARRWSQSSTAAGEDARGAVATQRASSSSSAAENASPASPLESSAVIVSEDAVSDSHSSPPHSPLPRAAQAQRSAPGPSTASAEPPGPGSAATSEATFIVVDPATAIPTTVIPAVSPPPMASSPPSMPPIENANLNESGGGLIHTPKSLALPEDDGQSHLRHRLLEISHLDLPERERARKMHELMTEKWNASQASRTIPLDLDLTPARSPANDPADADNPYKLLPGDDRTTYYSGPNPLPDVTERGCAHYRRNVRLQCSTCERWYTCRFCHDENEDHALIRQQTKNMLCMPCGRPQPAGHDCRYCGVRSAKYYCDKCKLWDDDPQKSIYHCNDCGICRIGQGLGKDFFHCKKCGVCMSIKLENSHRCIERSTECDCPICGEFMFTSTLTVVFMTCGHSIHHKCYYEHMKTSYRCPTCARTIINMESQFRALDIEIQNQPLPEPYSDWRCLISCNDCPAKSNVPFHFLGLKCCNCQSYNTSQIRILRPEDEPNLPAGNPAAGNAPQLPLGANMAVPAVAALAGLGLAERGASALEQAPIGSAAATLSPQEIEQRRRSGASSIEIATGMDIDHGDDDLIVDDDGGWVSESEPETEGSEYEGSSVDGRRYDDDDDDDDDDDGEDELINLIGHL